MQLADVRAPAHTIRTFNGPLDTIAEMVKMVKGARGERSIVVYRATEHVVRGLQPKDYLSEILAIRHFVAEKVRYKNDPRAMETVSDPERIITEIAQYGRATADCDDITTIMATMLRQVGREAEFVTVGFGRQGKYSHVFVRVREPKSERWVVCDPVAGLTEATMLSRVTTWRFWRID
jgi:hypothetical protein